MAKELVVSESVRKFAEGVIADKQLVLDPAKVEYVLVSPNISKTRPARITRSNEIMKLFSDADYVVQVSEDVWNLLGDDIKTPIIHQLLMRINPVYNEKKGEWAFKFRSYDYSGFQQILSNYGTKWYNNMKVTVSSIHDLSPEQSDSITVA